MNFNRPKFASGAMPLLTRDVLRASASLNFPSIAAGGNTTLTIAVPGAVVGDDVVLGYTAAPSTQLLLRAYVSANDVVTVRADNLTAGAIDEAATTYRVIVFKAY